MLAQDSRTRSTGRACTVAPLVAGRCPGHEERIIDGCLRCVFHRLKKRGEIPIRHARPPAVCVENAITCSPLPCVVGEPVTRSPSIARDAKDVEDSRITLSLSENDAAIAEACAANLRDKLTKTVIRAPRCCRSTLRAFEGNENLKSETVLAWDLSFRH